MVKVDPRLATRLAQAASNDTVEAILILDPKLGSEADAFESPADLVARVTKEIQQEPRGVKIFPRLGAVYLSASRTFVEYVLKQKTVVSAMVPD